ncbi:hypothetical protein D3C84_709770 [compost metagenome]
MERGAIAEAERAARKRRAEVEARRGTFGELMDAYVESLERAAKVSAKEIKQAFQLHVSDPYPELVSPKGGVEETRLLPVHPMECGLLPTSYVGTCARHSVMRPRRTCRRSVWRTMAKTSLFALTLSEISRLSRAPDVEIPSL